MPDWQLEASTLLLLKEKMKASTSATLRLKLKMCHAKLLQRARGSSNTKHYSALICTFGHLILQSQIAYGISSQQKLVYDKQL